VEGVRFYPIEPSFNSFQNHRLKPIGPSYFLVYLW